jgi:peptidoglycan/xylan/chitin deacetylase (PgdA/CDA1 family)
VSAAEGPAPAPLLSVLVASHNRRERLRRLLASLAAQDAEPAGFEVVVALDGTGDGSAEELAAAETPFALKVLELPKGGKAAALNAAIEEAAGEVCVYLDDDMICAPELISTYAEAFRAEPRTLALGAIVQVPTAGGDWTSQAYARAWNKMFAEREGRAARWTDCYGGNFAAPRASVVAVGGVKSIAVAEDLELGYRLWREGCVPTFLPAASAVHDDQKPGPRVLAERGRQGRAHVELVAEAPELEGPLLTWGPWTRHGESALVRTLIALRVPAAALAAAGPAVPRRFEAVWLEIVEGVAFWGAVRRSVDKARWRELTGDRDETLRAEEGRGAAGDWEPGAFAEPTPREVALRRGLLRLGVPPSALARAARPMPGGARDTWLGFVRRYAFWRGARGSMSAGEWKQATAGVPVLMYHAFTAAEEGSRYVMPAATFARQMRLLATLGYKTLTVDELARALREGTPLPGRAVAITIDDGYRDNLEVALPILRRHGFRATVFLVSGRLGEDNDWDGDEAPGGRPIVTAAEVAQMRAGGLRFGAHTRSHCRLTEADEAEVREQIGGSRRDLEAALGTEVTEFSYPYGLYDERALAAVAEAGYGAAVTTYGRLAGPGDDPFEIPRLEVKGTDSLLAFARMLTLGSAR